MSPRLILTGINLSQIISFIGLIMGFFAIWLNIEVRLAAINVDLTNLKQDMIIHKSDNRKDLETLRNENNSNTRELIRKVDEMQIYLRKEGKK